MTYAPKVISHPCKIAKLPCLDARSLWVDGTSAMSKEQMMKISRNFRLYTFAKSPRVAIMVMQGDNTHTRWEIITQGENAHMRWEMVTQGENGHVRWEMVTRADTR